MIAASVTTNGTTAYAAYDNANRLCWSEGSAAAACASPPSGATTYTSDNAGNRTTRVVGGVTTTYAYDAEQRLKSVATGGTTTAHGSTVAVRGAKEILVLVRVAVIYDEARRDATALTRSLAALPSDYDALLARHAPLHGAMFNRTRLSLDGDAADHRLPAQALFAKSTLDQPLPALLEKQFDACRYLILSSSGPEFPPTLLGIWGGTFSPAWSSGYTSDGNLPVAVVGSLPANLPETLQGF